MDLVLLPQAGPYLALDVVSGELLVSADPVRESEYEFYVLRRAGDLAFYERERRHQLLAAGVLDDEAARRMTDMAGYRNRLVHFYDEVTPE